jgi:hypothetical protein
MKDREKKKKKRRRKELEQQKLDLHSLPELT